MTYPEEGYTLHNLLSGLFNFEPGQMGSHNKEHAFKQTQTLQCPKCQLTFSQFKRVGKFGCATCYETFSDRLVRIFPPLLRANGKPNGKIPKLKGGNFRQK